MLCLGRFDEAEVKVNEVLSEATSEKLAQVEIKINEVLKATNNKTVSFDLNHLLIKEIHALFFAYKGDYSTAHGIIANSGADLIAQKYNNKQFIYESVYIEALIYDFEGNRKKAVEKYTEVVQSSLNYGLVRKSMEALSKIKL